MSFYRARPPANQQNLTDSCWAAALDSFTRITAGVPTMRERDLITTYGTGPTGALDAAHLESLRTALRAHGVQIDLLPYLNMPYDLEDRLRKSHVVLARQVSGNDWHAWVVYGVDNYVMYMDPRDGAFHTLNWSAGGFVSGRGWYLFWKP
jgi:hypothetical protein